LSAQLHAGLETVLLVRSLADRNHELPGLLAACPVDAKDVPLVAVLPLIERSKEADARLNTDDTAAPRDLL
jgi:hypothetical protein